MYVSIYVSFVKIEKQYIKGNNSGYGGTNTSGLGFIKNKLANMLSPGSGSHESLTTSTGDVNSLRMAAVCVSVGVGSFTAPKVYTRYIHTLSQSALQRYIHTLSQSLLCDKHTCIEPECITKIHTYIESEFALRQAYMHWVRVCFATSTLHRYIHTNDTCIHAYTTKLAKRAKPLLELYNAKATTIATVKQTSESETETEKRKHEQKRMQTAIHKYMHTKHNIPTLHTQECMGLAHFLEHMLFMGSEKYPKENEFDAYLSKFGGENNAYTDSERTVYHFTCPQEALNKSLDIFAQFFINPLLLPEAGDRELKSIESEFALRQVRYKDTYIHPKDT